MKTTTDFPNHDLVDLTIASSSSSSSSSSSESTSSTALLSADKLSPTASATRRRFSQMRSTDKESTKSPRTLRQERRSDRNVRWNLSNETQQPTYFTHNIAHIIPISSQEQNFGALKQYVSYAMGDPIAQKFIWRRILLIILAIILGYIVLSELIQYLTWTTVYHDWWYLREAVLNDEFAKRPFLYDVRYFVLADAIQPNSSNMMAQTPEDVKKTTTGTTID